MKLKLIQSKSELKAQSQLIRELKSKRKSSPNGYVSGLAYEQWQYRHKHIAYCLTRGRAMDEIENKVAPGNEPDADLINKYLKEYSDEVVRACG